MVLYVVRVVVFSETLCYYLSICKLMPYLGLVLSIVFSIIVLGLAAHLQSLAGGIALNFADLAIASSLLTIVTLPVL
jgi:hypothetical protein